MRRYCPGHRHGGSRFFAWLLASTGLARERGKQTNRFLGMFDHLLGHVLKQDEKKINEHVPQIIITLYVYNCTHAVYIISALYSLL